MFEGEGIEGGLQVAGVVRGPCCDHVRVHLTRGGAAEQLVDEVLPVLVHDGATEEVAVQARAVALSAVGVGHSAADDQLEHLAGLLDPVPIHVPDADREAVAAQLTDAKGLLVADSAKHAEAAVPRRQGAPRRHLGQGDGLTGDGASVLQSCIADDPLAYLARLAQEEERVEGRRATLFDLDDRVLPVPGRSEERHLLHQEVLRALADASAQSGAPTVEGGNGGGVPEESLVIFVHRSMLCVGPASEGRYIFLTNSKDSSVLRMGSPNFR